VRVNGGSSPWWRAKTWWIDHWADVIGAIVIPLLLYMIDCNSKNAGDHLVQQQIELQQLSMKQSTAESDNHQALTLVADMGTRIGDQQLAQRQAIAQAILEYAMQGRLYHPSTAVIVDYMKRECDATTYGLLNQAVEEAFRHIPKNAPIPSCDEKDKDSKIASGCRKVKAAALAQVQSDTDADKNLLSDAEAERSRICAQKPAAVQSAASMLSQYVAPGPRQFRQYMDVGCAETNQGTLPILLSAQERNTLRVASVAKPHFEGISNLNWEDANAKPDGNGDSIAVTYAIRGLDRQFLGNCPGGGHATLVVDYQLASRITPEQQQR
jgi:hypothetical protein